MSTRRVVPCILATAVMAGAIMCAQAADDAAPASPPRSGTATMTRTTDAWRTSPFHKQIDGATGKPIPCVCRFRGEGYRLGATVCMQTHMGVVIARCDLLLNNTTWAPTDQPCTTSQRLLPVAPG